MNILEKSFPIFKKIAFQVDAELAHEMTIKSMKFAGPWLLDNIDQSFRSEKFFINAMGLRFQGPFGLAAGLDKNAEAISFLTQLPFASIEVGTVTPLAQDGNPKPRLWRYVQEESLRNAMGFNNFGSDVILDNVINSDRREKILGVNLGKNKITANEKAALDYSILYEKFAPHVDYLVINVSSPNTPGLRDLLSDTGLRSIFEAVSEKRKIINRPLLVKVSPDMGHEELSSVVNLVKEFKLSGIIATNTTIMPERGAGGVSGKLLYSKARDTRRFLLSQLKETPEIELIGVGGFSSYEDLIEFWKQGGRLVQIYSAFIFQGPAMLYQWEKRLVDDMNKLGVKNFSEFLTSFK